MKAYVVYLTVSYLPTFFWIDKVFLDRDKAEKYCRERKQNPQDYEYHIVEKGVQK